MTGIDSTCSPEAAEFGTVTGKVVHGDKIGRNIGFPTATLDVSPTALPHGIYAGIATLHSGPRTGQRFLTAVSHGRRPTVGGQESRLECHFLDFSDDIYGCEVEIELVKFLRPDIHFDHLDDLVAAIRRDVDDIRQLFSMTR
ncbi:riboflavin kinase [Psychromarinibacter sp. C21-152]|uniref:riboflavin kinase n=1 Tax=Psychromarinibacter sediminicola TaxID=3033385 RepID=A0AAE3NUS2_9RHOB|nr:riboflavin kinase [Psychromarinibacter sediminicola]MDF0600992.1 riboflavin kinase [Psychromarinibacter sediminicola]